MSLPPLPAQWDRARVYSTNATELSSLSAADRELISAWSIADTELSAANLRALVAANNASANASRVAAGLPTLEEEERAIAEEVGLLDYDKVTQKDLFDVARSMYENGFEVWGFVVLKTWGCKEGEERERWDMFWRRCNEMMDKSLRDVGAVGESRGGFPGKLLWHLVELETMDGKGFKEVRDHFAELVEEILPSGLDLDLCLVIDKESVDSLLGQEQILPTAEEEDDVQDKAFVWGVDVNGNDDEDNGGLDDEYLGYFKI